MVDVFISYARSDKTRVDFDDWREDPHSPQAQEVIRALGTLIARQRALQSAANSASGPSASAHGHARLAICVLPFANMSGDPEQEYLAQQLSSGWNP